MIYLNENQTAYNIGDNDQTVYIILFGKVSLRTENNTLLGEKTINIGWTLGEEILFDRNFQLRRETSIAAT